MRRGCRQQGGAGSSAAPTDWRLQSPPRRSRDGENAAWAVILAGHPSGRNYSYLWGKSRVEEVSIRGD